MGGDTKCADEAEPVADEYGVKIEKEQPFMSYVVEDTKWVVMIGVPMIIGGSSKMLTQMAISVIMGRRDTNLLAAVTVSGIWTGWIDSMIAAGAGQIGTLCSMAYG